MLLSLDIYHTLFVGISQVFLGSYVMLLIDFRRPVPLWRKRWIFMTVLVVCANLIGLLFFDFWDTYCRVGVWTVTLPYILITFFCSRKRDFRAVFSIATGMFIGCVGTVMSSLAEPFLGYNEYYSLAVRTISFLLMFFVLRRFRSAYREMLVQLDRGWGILCIIPVVMFLIMMYLINEFFSVDYAAAMMLSVGLMAVCGSAYYLMYLFFEHIQKETEANKERDILKLQLSALRSRTEAVKTAENFIRVERHDLRHRMQAVRELVERGDQTAALDVLDDAQKRLDENKVFHWCRPPVLDAMFTSYFSQARRQGIRVEAKICLPDTLPVEEAELAVVFANILENAIRANMELPVLERKLRCKVVGVPSLMIEIVNPCAGQTSFDEEGLPMAKEQGHGLGVQSVSSFCRKYNAVCRFEQIDGCFRVQLVL